MPRILLRFVLAVACFTLALTFAPPALAAPPSPELMAKLAAYAQAFESQEKRLSYTIAGSLEVLDADNKVTQTFEGAARVEATGGDPKVTVTKYTEDGVDKAAEAQKETREAQAKHKKKHESGKDLKMPILGSQQDAYVFDVIEQSEDGTRARIQFTPKEPAQNTVDGSAWVDVAAGTVLSATFRMSKTPIFVSYLHFAVELGERTSLGPAVSKITVDGEGGILFLRRKFHASATLSAYTVRP